MHFHISFVGCFLCLSRGVFGVFSGCVRVFPHARVRHCVLAFEIVNVSSSPRFILYLDDWASVMLDRMYSVRGCFLGPADPLYNTRGGLDRKREHVLEFYCSLLL